MRKNNKAKGPEVKFLIAALIILLAISLIMGYIWRVLTTSDYFKIKEVVFKGSGVADLSYLKGKNIFTVDLKSESQDIIEGYPNYDKIRLIRVLPNRIFVDFVKRVPIAFVKLSRYFAVDEDGVLFYTPEQPEGTRLPVILGIQKRINSPKPGVSYNNIRELALAINIAKEAAKNKNLKDYRIIKIDVTSASNTSIFMLFSTEEALEGSEVKFGEGNVKEKINILSGLFTQGKTALSNIKYIDLRFNEPVIKLKNVK
ncbi:MAG: cell division protein FtsQ/DivIB [Candidatus Omnitrophica bacterium]|nr:cell division protein FtsQ/DivIB [Candidatus Omnitrophota bacterium]